MVEGIKKVELHLHLEGSIMLNTAKKIANREDVENEMVAYNARNLDEYLTKFDLPIILMQTKENIKNIARDLVKKLEKDNVIYAEIRFCPIKDNISMEDVIDSVLEGLKSDKVKTNLILCMMRVFNEEKNMKIIDIASKYLNKGVVAIDLAGDEKSHKLKEFISLFELAKKKNIPFTIHAGEVDDIDVTDALNLGVNRIGHGIKSNKQQLEIIKERKILLEICPTSNVDTRNVIEYSRHNVYDLYKDGVNISINTDNLTVSNIDLNQEYKKLIMNFGFTIEDLININKNAIKYAFLSEEEKEELLKKYEVE